MENLDLNSILVNNGFSASLNFNVLRQASSVWFETLISVVNGLTIPDYNDGKEYMRGNTFSIDMNSVSDISMIGIGPN